MAFRTLFESPIVKFINGWLQVFLLKVYILKKTEIDHTIEIRIIILVEIFAGIKKHCAKKTTGFTNIKIQMILLPPPRNFGCTFRI